MKMKPLLRTLHSMLRRARGLTVVAPFWLMALIAFQLRLFVVPPLGALLALWMGTVWCLGNADRIRDAVLAVRRYLFS